MSQGNVEAFKRAVDARNRRDTEAFLNDISPEVEWHPGIAARLKGRETVYRGHAGVREWLRDLDEVFAEIPIEVSEIRDLGDQVLAFGHVRGRGLESGVKIESPIAYLVDFEHGKIVRTRTYLDHGEALEAAGLAE